MKHLLMSFTFILIGYIANAQIITIPDANFKAKLLAANPSNAIAYNGMTAIKIDTNDNNEIEVSEALQVNRLNVSIADIYDLTGIGFFTSLRSLNCSQNHIPNLDLSNLTNLKSLYCNLNLLTSLNLNGLNQLLNLECAENTLTQIDFANLASLETLNCRFNFLTSLNLNGQINLQSLNCDYNQLTALDVSNLTQLTDLSCQSNQFIALDLNDLASLTSLNCSYNQLETLNLNNLNGLTALNCSHNQITTLDITNLSHLSTLNCESNQIGNAFIFSDMPDLEAAYCHNNQIPSFSFSDVSNLQILDCSANQISNLDVSPLPQLLVLNCHNNPQLLNLNIKNGSNEPFLDFSNNPNLVYICADEDQLTNVQNLIAQYGYTNCEVNSLCDLATTNFDLSSNLRLFPNPSKNYINLEVDGGLTIESISIYDIPGQTIIAIPNAGSVSVLNVSELNAGIYFIKFETNKGTATTKFIKG
ncbi:T9SS type A sorting domain-containing protein [Flavobacterium wongokense]|uniref:T9SS type A sorting domain-containing protein n=1 Tax=Flavobacterium wongokense TaxID=2910674 RepID=UPI001F2D9F0C|nr:T9SS type A sorting domain-containing protein [Flavobacterium sp. WG47]MCF6131029.1 T9SS type A sorting domain-containing protein [Flavobacterium sp. WG47]